MTKPWNPKAPPMSLHESQKLLNAEKDHQNNLGELKVIGQFALGIALLLFALFVFGGLLFDFATRFR